LIEREKHWEEGKLIAPYDWLLFGAAVPLFGAAVLFLLWGGLRYVVASDKSKFTYHWPQALDSLGWLYGGAVLAFQAGAKGWGHPKTGIVPFYCFVAAAICLLLLIAAMTERGQNGQWAPPKSLAVISVALVVSIVGAGLSVQFDTLPPSEGSLAAAAKLMENAKSAVEGAALQLRGLQK